MHQCTPSQGVLTTAKLMKLFCKFSYFVVVLTNTIIINYNENNKKRKLFYCKYSTDRKTHKVKCCWAKVNTTNNNETLSKADFLFATLILSIWSGIKSRLFIS